MDVWLVRHAIAADRAADSEADFDRPLTEHGREVFGGLAQFLVEHLKMPERIVSSPLVRAVQTAELLGRASGLKTKDSILSDVLAPGMNIERLLEFLRRQDVERIALVGHEPDMSRCTSELIGGGRIAFGKGNIASIRFDDALQAGAGELRWFVGPKLL